MAVVVCAICAVLYLVVLVTKAGLAWSYARRYPRPSPKVDLSTATIVQAILSGDPDLEAALRHNLETVREARFLWLIDDDDAEADAVTGRLVRDHPAHRIERLKTAAPRAGINPKLFKLEQARAAVSAGAFVVLDDDTRLTREGLAALIAALETATLSTGLPCGEAPRGTWSGLVAQFVNNNAALTYLPLLHVAPAPTINGMAYAVTPGTLASMHGFAPVWRQLADDLAVARRVLGRGGTIAQTPFPHVVATTVRDVRHYRALMHRWFLFALLLLREQSAAWRVLIAGLYGVPPVLLWIAIVAGIVSASWAGASIVGGALVGRALTLIVVQHAITGRNRHSPLLSIASELFQPWHLVDAALRRTIRWRTRQYVVHANDDFRPV
jgi:ceramide glucosyltransferase